ncbi:hypothetical protein CMO88_04685 [Candidatus Woesearchaeota archaeon]|jgi:hypothetical protein|nr:hypothetical protein [Candidatus Woesearchaeota archaeon]|tara:strand:- start:4308 stop:4580 length:273 start_codon:yes stop_codon:yes gene_type:complete
MKTTELYVKTRIISKLVQWRKWGGSHTQHILEGLPSHLKGEKTTKKAIKDLERREWLLSAKKTKEKHYFLNPRKAKEILEFYEKYCKPKG